MKAGDIFFYKPYDLESDMIAFWTKGPFSHCEVALNEHTTVAAFYPKIIVREPTNFAEVYTPDEGMYTHLQDGIDFLLSCVGKPYGLWDIVIAGVSPLGDWYSKDISHYDCSAMTLEFMEKAGHWSNIEQLNDNATSPNDIARYLGVIKS